jgi:hypothetical protein
MQCSAYILQILTILVASCAIHSFEIEQMIKNSTPKEVAYYPYSNTSSMTPNGIQPADTKSCVYLEDMRDLLIVVKWSSIVTTKSHLQILFEVGEGTDCKRSLKGWR